jgi:photosystem II stability/assembly factor-like uncharacterized protein
MVPERSREMNTKIIQTAPAIAPGEPHQTTPHGTTPADKPKLQPSFILYLAIVLSLFAAPALTAQQENFGTQIVGTTSAEKALPCCFNQGSIYSISYRTSVTGEFATGPSNTCSVNGILPPLKSCKFSVVFTPKSAGVKNGGATYVYIGIPNYTQTWPLTGVGVAPPPPPPTATPTFSLPAGQYIGAKPVSITDATPGAIVYWGTGNTPNASFARYSGPITVSTSEILRTYAIKSGYSQSAVASASYSIVPPRTWTSLLPLFTGSINNIALDASGNLYVIASSGGVFKSVNRGQTWTSASGDLPAAASGAVAVDPRTPGVIYVSAEGGMYKSSNGGSNWTRTTVQLSVGSSVTAIAVATGGVFVSTYGSALQCSADGISFSSCSSGLSSQFFTSIAVNPLNSKEAFAAAWRGQLFHTLNAGQTWAPIGGPGPWGNTKIYFSPSNPKIMYATNDEASVGRGTVLKSIDGGVSWFNVGRPDGVASDVGQISVSPLDPETVYATTSKGLFKTSLGGGTWAPVFAPPAPFQSVVSIASDANSSSLFMGSSYTGFYKSSDGTTFQQANTGLAATNISGLDVCKSNPSDIYLGATGVGLLESVDAGVHWSAVATPSALASEVLSGLACDPQNSSILMVSGYGSQTGDLWRSSDSAATFSVSQHGIWPGVIAFNPLTPNEILTALQDWQGGIGKSNNSGASFSVPYAYDAYPNAFLFHPTQSAILFTSANQYTGAAVDTVDIAYSSDSGASWKSTSFGQGNFVTSALDERDPTTIYVAGTIANVGSGIFKFKVSYGSGPGVASITRIPGDFNVGLNSSQITQLLYDATAGRLYAATGNGVYFSEDQATTWAALNQDLPYLLVSKIALSPDGSLLYAGTNGGVYVLLTK